MFWVSKQVLVVDLLSGEAWGLEVGPDAAGKPASTPADFNPHIPHLAQPRTLPSRCPPSSASAASPTLRMLLIKQYMGCLSPKDSQYQCSKLPTPPLPLSPPNIHPTTISL